MPDNVNEKTRVLTPEQHQALMQTAFDQVCDPEDWKGPIDCIVPWGLANVYLDAILFMTGAAVQSTPIDYERTRCFRLTSPGYRMGPAGP